MDNEAKVISAMEARKRFGEIMNRVALRGERYIVERSGKPLVSIAPVAEKGTARKINLNDPFENPYATFTEWNDPSNDMYDDLGKKKKTKRGSGDIRAILKRLRFSDSDKNLSRNIDKIVYGSNR